MKGGEHMNKAIIISVILIIVAAAGGFFGGMQYQKMQAPALGNRQFYLGQGGARFGTRGANGLRPTLGDVISQDSNSITVKLSDGSTKIVLLPGSTMIMKSSSATATDIKVGDKVMVFGAQNSDGSVTAQNVQINPPQRSETPAPTQSNQ